MYIKIFPPKDPLVYMFEIDSYRYEWSEVGKLDFVDNRHGPNHLFIPIWDETYPEDEIGTYVASLVLRKGKDPLNNWVHIILGGGCTIYIMGNDGKTIDTILT